MKFGGKHERAASSKELLRACTVDLDEPTGRPQGTLGRVAGSDPTKERQGAIEEVKEVICGTAKLLDLGSCVYSARQHDPPPGCRVRPILAHSDKGRKGRHSYVKML